MIRRGSAALKHGARVAWLRPRVALYPDVPGIDQDVSPEGRAALDLIVGEMKALGLVSGATSGHARETVRRLLTELRRGSLPESQW